MDSYGRRHVVGRREAEEGYLGRGMMIGEETGEHWDWMAETEIIYEDDDYEGELYLSDHERVHLNDEMEAERIYDDQDQDQESEVVREALKRLSRRSRSRRHLSIRSVDDETGIMNLLSKLRGEKELFHYCEEVLSINRAIWKQSWRSFADYFLHALEESTQMQMAMQRAIEERNEHRLVWTLYLSRTMDMYEDRILSQERAAQLADLTNPHELYPEARDMERKIIFHVGPTNSGKTYNAFQRLFSAKSGIYAAPLRLLAAEGYNKMKNHGLQCNLLTGDHKIITSEDATHVASTVEMAALNSPVDVAVIDEIQMAGDADRGWAWTRALLGIRSKEIHICGEERAVNIMKDICSEMGENMEVRKYNRLTKLAILSQAIDEDLRRLRRGDCVITFSRVNIFKLKAEIERQTRLKCAVVFGGLPPESRLEQARLFNQPDSKYDILVATDAVGYGLNLNIGRIVFHTLMKFDGIEKRFLEPAQIRQIAGRAGRFGTRFPDGEVTCFRQEDCMRLKAAFRPDAVRDLEQVGLKPSTEQLEYFSEHYDGTHKLSELIEEFEKLTKCSENYFLCDSEDQKQIADLLHNMDLPFQDRVTFTHVPIDTDEPFAMRMLRSWAKNYSQGLEVNIYVDAPDFVNTSAQLKDVEVRYKILEAYSWLSYRYPEQFVEGKLAEKRKRECRKVIDIALKDPVLLKEFEQRRRHQRARRRSEQYDEHYVNRGASTKGRRHKKKQRFKMEQRYLRRKTKQMGFLMR